MVEEVGTDRVLRHNYSGGEQTITIPTSAAVVAFGAGRSASRGAQGLRP
jgi:hypothetical protein